MSMSLRLRCMIASPRHRPAYLSVEIETQCGPPSEIRLLNDIWMPPLGAAFETGPLGPALCPVEQPLVSAWRYEWLTENNWNISWGSRTRWQLYAKRNVGPTRATLRMHREIMQAIDPKQEDIARALFVDHRNGQTLDNRDENLAWATPAENRANTRPRDRIPSLELIVGRLLAQVRPARAAIEELAATF
jgi:hypothetical protein